MSDEPRVSVIILSFGAAAILPAAVRSRLAQTYPSRKATVAADAAVELARLGQESARAS